MKGVGENTGKGTGTIMRASAGKVKLSSREKQVLAGIAEDLAYKEVAGRLGISTRSVAERAFRLMRELRVSGKAGLKAWAISHPKALSGEWVNPDMHPSGCKCAAPYCRALREMRVA